MVDVERLREDLNAAIQEVIRRHEQGSLVTSWVAVVETWADGGRGSWMLAPVGAQTRDTLGLLTHALEIERAAIVAERVIAILREE